MHCAWILFSRAVLSLRGCHFVIMSDDKFLSLGAFIFMGVYFFFDNFAPSPWVRF